MTAFNYLLCLSLFFPICLRGQVETRAMLSSPKDSFTDSRDGSIYKSVEIGGQVWMAENLRYEGSNPHVTDNVAWDALSDNNSDRAYCYYKNNSSLGYGCLYTWAAAKDACPSGWHLPSDAEWIKLEHYLSDNGFNWDGSRSGNRIGKSMSSNSGWKNSYDPGDPGSSPSSNNRSGFNALPGGHRDTDGRFFYCINLCYWWSSTQRNSREAYTRDIRYNYDYLHRGFGSKDFGFSVRCLKN